MDTKTRAIVLKTVKYGEGSLIVDMLTEKMGRVSFIVRIPKTKKGKLRKQFFQPMTILAIVFDYRQNAGLQHLRDVRLAFAPLSISFDPAKLSITMFLAEFLTYATRGEQGGGFLFQFIENGLRWLDGATSGYANFHIVFMVQMSRFVGFWPNLDDYAPGCIFDMREGNFANIVPTHRDFLNANETRWAKLITEADFNTMKRLPLNGEQRSRIAEVIVNYYRLHIPGMPQLRSLEILHDVFK